MLDANRGFGAGQQRRTRARHRAGRPSWSTPDVELIDDGLLGPGGRGRLPRRAGGAAAAERGRQRPGQRPPSARARCEALVPAARRGPCCPRRWTPLRALAQREARAPAGPWPPASRHAPIACGVPGRSTRRPSSSARLELCLRAAGLGAPTLLRPGVRVRHLGGTSVARSLGGDALTLAARRRRAVVAGLGRRALALRRPGPGRDLTARGRWTRTVCVATRATTGLSCARSGVPCVRA